MSTHIYACSAGEPRSHRRSGAANSRLDSAWRLEPRHSLYRGEYYRWDGARGWRDLVLQENFIEVDDEPTAPRVPRPPGPPPRVAVGLRGRYANGSPRLQGADPWTAGREPRRLRGLGDVVERPLPRLHLGRAATPCRRPAVARWSSRLPLVHRHRRGPRATTTAGVVRTVPTSSLQSNVPDEDGLPVEPMAPAARCPRVCHRPPRHRSTQCARPDVGVPRRLVAADRLDVTGHSPGPATTCPR